MEANRDIDREESKANRRELKEMMKMMATRLERMDPSHKNMVAKTKLERDMEPMACQMTEARQEEEKPTSVDRMAEVAEQ
jgi:peroxiredoxin family protein